MLEPYQCDGRDKLHKTCNRTKWCCVTSSWTSSRWQEWVQSKPCECHPQNVPNHESSIAMTSQNYSAENLLQNPRNIPTQSCSWWEGGGIYVSFREMTWKTKSSTVVMMAPLINISLF
jgi:hypothetical protein